MYKQYLKKAQQGQSTGGRKYTAKNYVNTLIRDGIIDRNDASSQKALEVFSTLALGDDEAFQDLVNKYYGEDGYIEFRRNFDKIAPQLGIDPDKELGTARHSVKGWGPMTKDASKKFLSRFKGKYNCVGDYCHEPFARIIDEETGQQVLPSKIGVTSGKLKGLNGKDEEFTTKDYKVKPKNKRIQEKDFADALDKELDANPFYWRFKQKGGIAKYQAGGMLSGMPHEAGGQVLVDEQGNPMAEAEGGEIIFSVEVSSMIDEAANSYMQAKNDKDRDALALEVGRMVLEERIAQKQREGGGENMQEEEQGEVGENMQGAMQRGGRLRSKMIEKRLALLNEF